MGPPVLTRDEIFGRLKKLLVEEFDLRDEQVVPAAQLATDLDLDSIDWIDMAVALEVETGLLLLEEDLSDIRTIRDIVDVLHGKLTAGAHVRFVR
jgi:acyl carrier protein